MKRIYLLRHGKSDWEATYDGDHERPLSKRGVRSAKLMGRFLAAASEEPDLIVSSSAVRALTTSRLAAQAAGWDCEVRVEPDLYGATRKRVLEELQGLDPSVDRVLLTGHAPTSADVAGKLIGKAEISFPTAAVVCIDVPAARWEAVEFGRGRLVWFLPPRLIATSGWGEEP